MRIRRLCGPNNDVNNGGDCSINNTFFRGPYRCGLIFYRYARVDLGYWF